MSNWQTVPKEPTEAMVDEACAAWVNLHPAFKGEKPEPTAGDVVRTAYRAMLAAAPPPPAVRVTGEWKDISTAPKDGTPVSGQELYRFQPYKPEGQKQMGAPGRWQRYNGFGWENAPPPTHWMPLGNPIQQDADDIGQQEPGARK